MKNKLNNPEQPLYNAIYSNNKYSHYGSTNHGSKYVKSIANLNPASLIDVGCGHNNFVKDIKTIGLEKAVGVDFACPSADYISDIMDLPFKDKEFDFLTAWDVLEHLRKSHIHPAFKEMKRISKRFAFTIAYETAYTLPPPGFEGHNLHQCVENKQWWKNTISNYSSRYINKSAFWAGEWNDS